MDAIVKARTHARVHPGWQYCEHSVVVAWAGFGIIIVINNVAAEHDRDRNQIHCVLSVSLSLSLGH